ncbi:sensor histidine kinase [Lachnoclostridium sp. Marseille-P6806]|uniref:sensor histidine kinase n=1 Tax=Lachnoclostridium sp. Marseille-P6806 TaxID=2364793 RepID=UPI00102F98FF|nr:HAMP domain-containing protein [Lachnoclostridium sp. Marseille-P6806]
MRPFLWILTKKVGWQYIGISTDLIADTIEDYNFDPMSVLFVYDRNILTSILSNWLTKPIQRSIKALGRISGGDFSVDRTLEGDDEVGRMGRAINSLAINIDALMKQAREEESQKKQLEYKLLQNQINPHFVYNVHYIMNLRKH